jgi:N6-L-threonylcarbamoyladenine synthase
VISQWKEHSPYGGVVPEIAARAHILHLEPIIAEAFATAGVEPRQLDLVAVTGGPGLIGGVIVGVTAAKALASVYGKPFVAVNHLEGHALTARLVEDVAFPYLLLLASGGHCQLLVVRGVGDYEKLGGTMDDAMGEAFDKTAKLLGLGYPGGPAVETAAKGGDPHAYAFSVPLKGREGCDFSFSGLKTAVRMAAEKAPVLDAQVKADLCASFQFTVGETVRERLAHAIARFSGATLVVAGGVAANQYLRAVVGDVARSHGLRVVIPPGPLCTDNAAMIAWAGIERFMGGARDALDFEPRPQWPLS